MSVSEIKTNYGEGDSPQFTTLLNADHARIKNALGAATSGLALSGPGRLVGSDTTAGRAVAEPDALILRVPNARYIINGATVEVEDVIGFALIEVPPNMAAGKYGFLSLAPGGSVEVKSENWRDSPRADADAALAGLPCLGLVKSDAASVTALVYTHTDEIQSNNLLLSEIRSLQAQIDALGTPGGGGGTGTGGAARADLLPWDASDLSVTTKPKVLDLIAASEAGLKDYVDNGKTRAMALPDDYITDALVRTRASLMKLNPTEVAGTVEEAMVVFGFAGHEKNGQGADIAPVGVNSTDNVVIYTTLQVDTPQRRAHP